MGGSGRAGAAPSGSSHAVVIGASMAGLLAARVLADHFRRVTIVERDRLPAQTAPRKGVPQSRHIHVLLAAGRNILEDLFPGLGGELEDAGVRPIDAGQDFEWLTPAGWSPRFQADLGVLTCSRDLLDQAVRRQVETLADVEILQETEVTGLLLDPARTALTGVEVRRRAAAADGEAGHADPEVKRLAADLVVDAAGRTSKTPTWLEQLGFPVPEETVVSASLGYASRLYRRPAARAQPWDCVYLQAAPPHRTRAAVIFPIEGERWIVTLGGGGGDYPPTDEAGFEAFMHSLASLIVHDALSGAEPLSPIYGYRATENRWRHYERLAGRPEGLVVLGDAACTFNPVYGQGMTTAARGAVTLAECLREQRRRRPDGDLTDLARRFQRSLAKVNQAPWLLATSEDLRYRIVEGTRPGRITRWMHWYLDRVTAASTHDIVLRRVLLQVLHMTRPPSALFLPGNVRRALLRKRSTGAPGV